jgi:hypothetical protein
LAVTAARGVDFAKLDHARFGDAKTSMGLKDMALRLLLPTRRGGDGDNSAFTMSSCDPRPMYDWWPIGGGTCGKLG